MECGTREPRLQQRHHAALFQPLPYLGEGMLPIQNGQHQGFDPTPTREPNKECVVQPKPLNLGSNGSRVSIESRCNTTTVKAEGRPP
jgi:hypothetical protein